MVELALCGSGDMTGGRQALGPGQQPLKVGGAAVRELLEEIGQIRVGVQAVLFGGFDETINDGARLRAGGGEGEEPVLAANDEGFDAALTPIVIQLQPTILQEDQQLLPLMP